jgi:histidinol phosphatase-like enzyme (inositol monophosphatase family)
MNNLTTKIQLAEKLADISEQIICQYFRQPNIQSATKEGQISAIVTIADKEAENAMVEIILKEAPEDGIIREEGENIPSQNGQYWVLDPIDGTASFVRGFPIFGTLIALVNLQINTPLIGIVNQPILKEKWRGIKGQASQLNSQTILNPYRQISNSNLAEACLVSTTPLMFITEKQKAIATHLQQVCKRTAFGGDCYNYLVLASGWSAMPMVILEADMQYYDFCALIPIIEGAGGKITDWAGNKLTPASTEVLAASNQSLLEQALAVILS